MLTAANELHYEVRDLYELTGDGKGFSAMINLSIPGQMSENELRAIEALARSAPRGACIVEVGSLFGRSSFTWASSAPDSTIYCIDPWERDPWIIELENTIPNCPEFGQDAFLRFTSQCKNIIPIRGRSPGDVRSWNIPVDIFFDDAVHYNPFLRHNLRFWLCFMKPGGVMAGHDYGDTWPDVKAEVDALAHELRSSVSTCETLWWVKIPESFIGVPWWTKLLRRYLPTRLLH